MANKKYTVDWDKLSTTMLKNVTTLVVKDYSLDELSFNVDASGKLIVKTADEKAISFKKFSSLKYIYDSSNIRNNLITKGLIYYDPVITTPTKGKLTGTKYSDKICGTVENDKIYGGLGNDIIYSSYGNDTITGGLGINRIIYSGNFESDTVILTKGENLILDLTSYDVDDNCKIKYDVVQNNLRVIVYDEGYITGVIKIKDFGKKNTVGISGSVFLELSNGKKLDLNELNLLEYDEGDFNDDGIFNGSRFQEIIDASKMCKNITINAGGGYNVITGTTGYSDKITGGNDGNYIETGFGDKVITTGSGDDTIILSGRGNHTIKAGNGLNDITITGTGTNTVKTGSGNDIIKIFNADKNTVSAGNGNNEITVNSGENKIVTGKNSDIIRIKGTTTSTIYAGCGVNNIYIDNSKSYGSITIAEQKVSATNNIIFSTDFDDNYYLSKSGSDLHIINDANSSDITIKNYYSSGKKYAINNILVNDTPLTLNELISRTSGLILTAKGTINGTDNKDVIKTTDSLLSKKVYNDIITAGKGDDKINAGLGNNSIIFKEGDGQDTVYNGGGIDTLVFDEGTILNFELDGNNLVIGYGNSGDTVTISKYTSATSVQYIKIGDITEKISSYIKYVSRGNKEFLTDILPTGSKLVLKNKFGNDCIYEISSKNKTNAYFQYLANGRLVIRGNNLSITACDGQEDDIILLGDNNTISTGDEDDIVRIGYVIDADGKYKQKSDSNTINTGSGNDYITYYGQNQTINMGEGNDTITELFGNASVSNVENQMNALQINYNTLNNNVDSFYQGNEGGDCKQLSLLKSLSMNKNFNGLSDYVTITQNEDSYNVTFKNYTSGENSIYITKTELNNFKNVYGDVDVVLIDYALTQLMSTHDISNLDMEYRILNEYIFGNTDITYISQSLYNVKDCLYALWDKYSSGELDNITVGLLSNEKMASSIKIGHAYALKNLTEDFITLINPWDSNDELTLDIKEFMTHSPCIISYGTDLYDSLFDENITSSADYISLIQSETAAWNTQNSDITSVEYSYESENITLNIGLTPPANKDELI